MITQKQIITEALSMYSRDLAKQIRKTDGPARRHLLDINCRVKNLSNSLEIIESDVDELEMGEPESLTSRISISPTELVVGDILDPGGVLAATVVSEPSVSVVVRTCDDTYEQRTWVVPSRIPVPGGR